jgi:hypothetical protein
MGTWEILVCITVVAMVIGMAIWLPGMLRKERLESLQRDIEAQQQYVWGLEDANSPERYHGLYERKVQEERAVLAKLKAKLARLTPKPAEPERAVAVRAHALQ